MNKDNKDIDFQNTMDEAIKLHKQAVDGDKEAVDKAIGLFKDLYGKDPQNHIVQAYLGSITSLKGRDLFDMIERSKCASRGVKLLNQAVLGDKENIEIRYLRANVCYRLPEIYFHKTATAIEDLNYILARYEKDKNILTQKQYLRILYDLGCAYSNLELSKQADKTWDILLQTEGGEEYRDLILEKKGDDSGKAATPLFKIPGKPQGNVSDKVPDKATGKASEKISDNMADKIQDTKTNSTEKVEVKNEIPKPKKKVWTKL